VKRLLRMGLFATLLAGLVGVGRQRAEALAIRRGELTPASAASEVPTRAGYGPVARGLADWVPAAPATPAGRFAAAVWASPLTLVGLLLAALAGTRPEWDAERGSFIASGVGGLSGRALRAVGADANAVGQVVLSRRPEPPEVLLAHEAVHVRQAERLGPLLFLAYVWLAARYGYRDHPLERAARLGARRQLGRD
jgi:hypothetical protein